MPEPEAELQATADLSPVSPSPVHTASPLVVPALQDTVDTIDAMVAAVLASTGDASRDGPKAHDGADTLDASDIVDDDPYSDDVQPELVAELPQANSSNSNDDDYAKTFDSPIASDPAEEDHLQAGARNLASSAGPLSSHPSVASHSVLDPLLTHVNATEHAGAAQPRTVGSSLADSPSQPPQDHALANHQVVASFSSTQNGAQNGAQNGTSTAESAIDLQRLVADLTAQSNEPNSRPTPDSNVVQAAQAVGPNSSSFSSSALPSSSSLPPRPPLPNAASHSYVSQHHPGTSNHGVAAGNPAASPTSTQSLHMLGTSTPATLTSAAAPALSAPGSSASTPAYANERQNDDLRRSWEQFVADERQYMSEAKWDRFPEGSRIFIGNLSSDKVSKRDVFDLFHTFGRLAQISLKSAYGFVQYHTVDEGSRAIHAMEGAEIKGRRIHLEVSKLQEKGKKDRGKSPDKGRGGREGGRRSEKHGNQRDDYRPRNHSPRRNEHNHDGRDRDRDRGRHDSGRHRNRSRSPGYGRNGRDYRRRSPSPYGRSRHDSEIDLPRRYGADVPDVQIILQPDVSRDFTAWVEGAFKSKGLKTEVMFLHPRIPKDQIIQRQAVEGVHAVVDLDLRAQHLGKIPVQAFDRSAGASNVRFDQYVDLDPGIAAEVIVRTKATSVPSYGGQPYQPPVTGFAGYGNPYVGHGQPPTTGYNSLPAYPAQPQASTSQVPDLANLIGKVDSRTLNQLLANLQGSSAAPVAARLEEAAPGAPATQHDIQAILSTLSGHHPTVAPPPQAQPAFHQYAGSYPPQGAVSYQPPANGDSAAQVQNIMAQLAKYRQ